MRTSSPPCRLICTALPPPSFLPTLVILAGSQRRLPGARPGRQRSTARHRQISGIAGVGRRPRRQRRGRRAEKRPLHGEEQACLPCGTHLRQCPAVRSRRRRRRRRSRSCSGLGLISPVSWGGRGRQADGQRHGGRGCGERNKPEKERSTEEDR